MFLHRCMVVRCKLRYEKNKRILLARNGLIQCFYGRYDVVDTGVKQRKDEYFILYLPALVDVHSSQSLIAL